MNFTLEFDRKDGPWIAEFLERPGVLAYAWSRLEAKLNVEALALRVFEDREARDHFRPEPR